MRKLLSFLLVISIAHANPWHRPPKETTCEFSVSRFMGAKIFQDKPSFKASNFAENIVFKVLDSKVRAMKKQNSRKNEIFLEIERSCGVNPDENTQRQIWNEYYKSELQKISTTHRQYLARLASTIEHALYHFSPATFYSFSCERGLSAKTCLVGKISISDYIRDPAKLALEGGIKFKVAEFNNKFISLLPYATYEKSKNWQDITLGAAAFLAKSKPISTCKKGSLIEKTLQPSKTFSYTSAAGSLPLELSYFTLKAEHLRGMENHFALCPYFVSTLKLDLPIKERMLPLLFFDQSIGIAKKLANITMYLQGTFKALRMPFLGKEQIKKSALKFIPNGAERDKLESELFNKSLLFLSGFSISLGIIGSL